MSPLAIGAIVVGFILVWVVLGGGVEDFLMLIIGGGVLLVFVAAVMWAWRYLFG